MSKLEPYRIETLVGLYSKAKYVASRECYLNEILYNECCCTDCRYYNICLITEVIK